MILTAHNWQKSKGTFITCPCRKIDRVEAVGLKSYKCTYKITILVSKCTYKITILVSKCTYKITILVSMWNLGQFRENLIFCQ